MFDDRSASRPRLVAVLAVALVGASVGAAGATTQMAIRTGLPCRKCHVNPSGGGMLTPYARENMQEITKYRDVFGLDAKGAARAQSPAGTPGAAPSPSGDALGEPPAEP